MSVGGTLREAFDYPFSRLDPFGSHIDPPSVAVYETLVVKGPDSKPHPGLAKAWSVAPDGRAWTFELRPGLHFHSGASLDAHAVVAALDRLRWGFYDQRQSWYWDAVDRVEAVSDMALRIQLHQPYENLPSLLWGTHTAIFNEALRAADHEAFGSRLADGTGPFRLRSWSPEKVVAERWDRYPGIPASFLDSRGPALIDSVEWVSLPSEGDRLEALERGEVHVLHGPVPVEVERLENDHRFTVVRHGQGSNFYLGLNWSRDDLSFDDLHVRRALSLAIDRDQLVSAAVAGHGRATWGPLPPWDPYYEPAVDASRKVERHRAQALLDQAGWKRAGGGIRERAGNRFEFECVVQDDDVHLRVAKDLQLQLREIGVSLKPRPVRPFKDFYSACEASPASFINKWLWQDGMDATIGFNASWCRPFPNAQQATVAELDEAFREWVRAAGQPALARAAGHAQRVFADQLPSIPLLAPDDIWVIDRRVRGYRPYPATLYPFYHSTRIDGQAAGRAAKG